MDMLEGGKDIKVKKLKNLGVKFRIQKENNGRKTFISSRIYGIILNI